MGQGLQSNAVVATLDAASLRPFRTFEEPGPHANSQVNSVSFHRSGEQFVTASDTGFIEVFDSFAGAKLAVLSAENGCHFVQHTHARDAIIYANNDMTVPGINYVSLHTQQCICSFGNTSAGTSSLSTGSAGSSAVGGVIAPMPTTKKARRPQTTCLAMSSYNDTFVSATDDGIFRLWDLREARRCVAEIHAPPACSIGGAPTHVTFDPAWTVMTACLGDGTICLFDARDLDGNRPDGPARPFHISESLSDKLSATNDRLKNPSQYVFRVGMPLWLWVAFGHLHECPLHILFAALFHGRFLGRCIAVSWGASP